MRWFFGYEKRLVPVRLNPTIALGDVGHRVIGALLNDGMDPWKEASDWVQALIDKGLFPDEIATAQELRDTAMGIGRRFWDQFASKYRVMATEQAFEVPVRGLRLHLLGRWDAVVCDDDGWWLVEVKIPKRAFRSEEDVELSTQIGIYHYAAIRLNLPVKGVLYVQCLGKDPAQPSLNKNGTMSRSDIATTWEVYSAALKQADLNPADYEDMRVKLADKEFLRVYQIYRSPEEVRFFMRDLERCIWDMARTSKHIYMCDNSIHCVGCSYRELCMEMVRGRGIATMIESAYEIRPEGTGREACGSTNTDHLLELLAQED